MTPLLPPGVERLVARELRRVPLVDRDDAVQEAWIAHLSGASAHKAVHAFGERQRRYHQRMRTGILHEQRAD